MHNQLKFVLLDGFRGLAALFVMTRHTQVYWTAEFPRSYLAVDLFFLLSGFVIAHAYDFKLQSGELSCMDFLKIRLVRLYPMYLISVVLCGILIALPVDRETLPNVQVVVAWVMSIGLIPWKVPHVIDLFPSNVVYWSLFFEIFVNAIYASLARRLNNRLIAVIVFLSWLLMLYVSRHMGGADNGWKWNFYSFSGGLSRALFGIYGGILLSRLRDRLNLPVSGLVVGIVLLCVISSAFVLPMYGRRDWVIDMVIVTAVFPICVAIGASTQIRRGTYCMGLLGLVSYPIYVLHKPIGEAALMMFPKTIQEYAPLSGILFTTILVGLAIVLERQIDHPLRAYLKERLLK